MLVYGREFDGLYPCFSQRVLWSLPPRAELFSFFFWAVRLCWRSYLFPEWLICQAHGWNEAAERGALFLNSCRAGRLTAQPALPHFHTAAPELLSLQTSQAAFMTFSKRNYPENRSSPAGYWRLQLVNLWHLFKPSRLTHKASNTQTSAAYTHHYSELMP